MKINKQWFKASVIVFMGLLASVGIFVVQASEWRHRDIWLKNELGERITPSRNFTEPYSPRKTCGSCHGYSTITSGYHFQQGFDEMKDGYDKSRPWILSPGNFGKGFLPGICSGLVAAKKNNSQREIDLSTYDWIAEGGKIDQDGQIISFACGWIHPGGGPLEHGRKAGGRADYSKTLVQGELDNRAAFDGDYSSHTTPDMKSHFRESGAVEADCLLCHSNSYRADLRRKELSKRNYRWAATAGAGLGEVKGAIFSYVNPKAGPESASFLEGRWNFSDRPIVSYFWNDKKLFTKEGKLKGSLISNRINSRNCLQCHRYTNAAKSGTIHRASYDVHVAAGFECTDCHGLVGTTKAARLRHQIAKGWSSQGKVKDSLDGVGMKTCVTCHIDGQYKPTREGLPKEAKNPSKVHKEKFPKGSFHFSLLHCAACHSTQQPAGGLYLIDASTGNHGLYTAELRKSIRPEDLSEPASKPWQPWMTRYERIKGQGERYVPGQPKVSQWFGERTASGEVRPIPLRYIRQAFKNVRGLSVVEVINTRGEKVKEQTVSTEEDIKRMIGALSGLGFRDVVLVSDKIYDGRHKTEPNVFIPVGVRGPTFPAHSERPQWFGEKMENGEIKPIERLQVLKAFHSLTGPSMVQTRDSRGKRVMKPVVETNEDMRNVIRSLSEMGFRNVVYVAEQLYILENGRLKSFSSSSEVAKLRKNCPGGAECFAESLEDGRLRPIHQKHVLKALDSLTRLSWAEVKNAAGEKVMEPTIATERDVRLMIEALSGMGLKNVVFVGERIYELKGGKIVTSLIPPTVDATLYPVFHNVVLLDKKKTYGAKGHPEGCRDCHIDASPFFTRMKVKNVGRFLKEDYPVAKEPNSTPQMNYWGIRNVPSYE